jgi:hypothetical protein
LSIACVSLGASFPGLLLLCSWIAQFARCLLTTASRAQCRCCCWWGWEVSPSLWRSRSHCYVSRRIQSIRQRRRAALVRRLAVFIGAFGLFCFSISARLHQSLRLCLVLNLIRPRVRRRVAVTLISSVVRCVTVQSRCCTRRSATARSNRAPRPSWTSCELSRAWPHCAVAVRECVSAYDPCCVVRSHRVLLSVVALNLSGIAQLCLAQLSLLLPLNPVAVFPASVLLRCTGAVRRRWALQ